MSREEFREEFLATVQTEDLEGDMALVAEQCGLEVAVRLVSRFGGTQVSIPKSGLKRAAIRYVRERYNGANAKTLALATGFTERFVYDAVAASPVKNDQHRLV